MTSSIRLRFGFSLGANLLKALSGFISGLLVARGLGPEHYGKMMFLLGTFTALRQLLDMGSATAFFTFLSQRARSTRFVGWFSLWLAVQFLVPFLAIGLLLPAPWIELIWKGEQRTLVLLAFVAAYLQATLWSVIMQMGESQRRTSLVQGVGVATACLHLLVIVVSWWQAWLSVRLIFSAMILEWALAAWVIARQLRFTAPADEKENFRAVLREFGRYCLPLIPYAWLGFAYEFADRWLLQNFGGSVQQAFYAVAFQFGAIASIATTSVLNVFWKEIAEAHQQADQARVVSLYQRVSRGLFFIAAAVAGFLVPWAGEILRLTLDHAYAGGVMALTIMFLYPMHQSMGQIGGTMLYATERVPAQVVIGLAQMSLSLVVTYFLLAPPDAAMPGLGLGSAGLAGKMVVLQFLTVNAIALYLAKSMQIRFDWVYQPLSGLGCAGAGWLAHAGSQWLFAGHLSGWWAMLPAAFLYGVMLAGLILLRPSLAGISHVDTANGLRRLGWQGRAR